MIKEGSSKKLHQKNSGKSKDFEPKMREMNEVQRSRRTCLSTSAILTLENKDSTTGTQNPHVRGKHKKERNDCRKEEGLGTSGYYAHYLKGKKREIVRKREDPTATSTYSSLEGEKD